MIQYPELEGSHKDKGAKLLAPRWWSGWWDVGAKASLVQVRLEVLGGPIPQRCCEPFVELSHCHPALLKETRSSNNTSVRGRWPCAILNQNLSMERARETSQLVCGAEQAAQPLAVSRASQTKALCFLSCDEWRWGFADAQQADDLLLKVCGC